MAFTLIKGTFHVVNYSPDGDSIRFKAKTNSHWSELETIRRKIEVNKNGHVQLRVEGADTLETHYRGLHQPKDLADSATDFLLADLKITNVRWGPTHSRVTSANDGTPGYILTRSSDPNGRPVSFVFAGTTTKADGSKQFLNRTWLKQSLNYKLLARGLAYPMYYTSLFWDLRQTMTDAVKNARKNNKGIWPYDWTDGVTVNNLESITDEYAIFPKLFRRLGAHLKTGKPLSTFLKEIKDMQEGVVILDIAHQTHFDNIVTVNGKRVKMTKLPENVAFVPN